MPRQRKPTALKRLAGNPGKRPLPEHEARPDPASTRAPHGLPREALKYWRKLAPRLAQVGLLSELDTYAAADLVTCLARMKEAEAIIEEEGIVIPSDRGGLVRHPAVMVANGYRAAFQRYCAKFGLTPSDRAGLEVFIEEEPDVLDQLFQRRVRVVDEDDS